MINRTDLWLIFTIIMLFVITLIIQKAANVIKKSSNSINVNNDLNESAVEIHQYRNVILTLAIAMLVFFIGYKISVKAGIENHVMDWLHLLVRWAHVVLGISWIGASFYFIFLENSLNRTEGLRDELAGNLWAVHGGGFYYVEKYKTAPSTFPKKLHWFKYEAYFTWLSGFILLSLVYYLNASTYMIDPSVADIKPLTAVGIGIGTLVCGWIIYDLLCKSALLQQKKLFALVGFIIVTSISFFLSHFLSGRAAFMHIGALLGTIMAGNVFFVIIPAQKALVKAAKEGKLVDPLLGKYAGLRSLHNNYMTLPVIFVMISNHFPTTFGNSFNWAILAGLTLMSVAVRHYINLHERGEKAIWIIPFAVVCLIALVIVTAPTPSNKSVKNLPAIQFTEIQPIIKQRCVVCHSAHPTDDVQIIAPNGIMFDSPEQVKKMSERILVRVVQTRTMPQGNKTGITDHERELIGTWIEQGAKIN